MRIVIDARLYGLEHAGLGRYTMNLVEELKKIAGDEEIILLLRKKYFKRLGIPREWKKVLFNHRHYSLFEQVKLPQILNKLYPDLVHFPHFNVPVMYNGRYVVTIHDLIMHKSKGRRTTTLPVFAYTIKRIFYRLAFDKAVNGSVSILVPSKAVKNEIRDAYKIDEDKICVTYEGLAPALSVSSESKGILEKYNLTRKYFFYVGNAYPHKNLDRAIEATMFFNEQNMNKTDFVIAGSRNVFTRRLQEYVEKHKAFDFVKLIGFIPDGELGTLMRNSVAFLYPSFDEGFGLQGLEAISSGTLLLASDIAVFKEVYKSNAIYFNPYDFSTIVEAMRVALKMSEGERKEFISKGQKFIKRFSWSKMAKETLRVYSETFDK